MAFELNKKQYVDYIIYSVTSIKGKYGFRVKLIYDDGTFDIQQKSGYKTKKEAENEKMIITAQLYNKTYIVYPNVKVEDYLLYWLENVMKKREKFSYNSYMSYRNVIKNYIIPFIRRNKSSNYKYGTYSKIIYKSIGKIRSSCKINKDSC